MFIQKNMIHCEKSYDFSYSTIDVFDTSLFHRYKYNALGKINFEFKQFIDFIKEFIYDNVNTIFKYIIGWIETMIQKPGVKNETALILKGFQGIGKNRITDIISELLAGYSCKNENKMHELTCNFYSEFESKMLISLNE